MKPQTHKRPVKAIINPGRRFTAPIDPREVIARRLVNEFAHLAPALRAAYERERAAVERRLATIERISDGPRCLGWFYKAAPGTPKSLLRTGWHAVGEPCPREVSDALLKDISDARVAWGEACKPIRAAAIAAGLSEWDGPETARAHQIAARVMWSGVSS